MLLIPYFSYKSAGWTKLGVFLCSAGRQIWEVADTDTDKQIKQMLKENGFPLVKLHRTPKVIFAEMKPDINLQEFYLWSEVDLNSDEDVWRIYNIPSELWPCQVFREHFWKTSGIDQFSEWFSEWFTKLT